MAQIDRHQGSAYLVGPAGTVKSTRDHLGSPGENLNTAFSPEPVNLDSGNFYHEHSDLLLPGRRPGLAFTRAYNSISPTGGPLGYGWSFNYGMRLIIDRSNPTMTKVTRVSEGGNGATFVQNVDGSYAHPPDVFETLTENLDGTFVLTRTSQIKFNFDATGRLTSIVDRNNNRVTLTYDATGLKQAADSNIPARHLDFTNDAEGRITRIDDPQGGRYVTFTYDVNGDLWQVRDVKGGITYFSYQNHRLQTITDANGNPVTTNTYDSAARVVEQVDGEQNRTCIYYGQPPILSSLDCPAIIPAPASNQTVLVNPRLNKTTYAFDPNFATTQTTDANGHTWVFSYEAAGALCSPNIDGNLCSVTDPVGHKTSFWYDGTGNVVTQTDALGNSTTLTYTALNDIASEKDPLGQRTEYAYDAAGNLTSVTRKDASGAQVAPPTLLGRDPSGNGDLISITDGNGAGHATTFNYDTNGLANLVTDPLGNVTDYDYDSAGRLTCVKDGEGNRTKYDYDEQNNIHFVHDAQNTTFVSGTCTPQAGSDNPTEYQYDAKGNRRFVINARGKTTQSVYDKMDRLKSVTDALLRVTSFTYDGDGNLKTRIDARSPNRTVTYVYDAADRLTNIKYPDVNLNVTYTYYDDGLRQTMVDSTGTTSYEYSAVHQLTRVTYPGSIVVQYQYDAAGNRTKVTYPDATKYVTYTYDAFNRMKTVAPNWLGSVTTYQYDNAGNLDLTTTATPGATLVADPVWDQANRLTSLTNRNGSTTISSYAYTLLDKVGNRKTVVDSSGTTNYSYDKLYRLTGVTYPNNDTQSYTYDQVGNRLTKVQNSVTTSYLYDDADELIRSCPATTCTTSTPGTYYGYEGNGVLAQFGPNNNASNLSDVNDVKNVTNQFLLEDYEGRYLRIGHCFDQYINGAFDGVVSVADILNVNGSFGNDQGSALYSPRKDLTPLGRPDGLLRTNDTLAMSSGFQSSCAGTEHLFYNGDGLRVQKWIGVNPNMRKTEYIWDIGSALPVELEERVKDSQGNLLATYDNVYGLDQLARTDSSGGASYYLYDGLGSTTGLASNSGALTDTYAYDVFGAPRTSSGTSTQPFRFTGEQQDTDATGGLYYLRARYYDPSLGRFWTRDPLSAGTSVQAYPYAGDNPVNLIDPLGLCPSGQIGVGPVPTPPIPLATPGPLGMANASIIRGEAMCITPLRGSGGDWSVFGGLWSHVAKPLRAAILSDCAHAGLQLLMGEVQLAPVAVAVIVFAASAPVSAPVGAAALGAAAGFETAVGLRLTPEQIFVNGPRNILQGTQGIEEECGLQ